MVGAGLIGLAVANAITESFTGISILVLDKEEHVAAHQSSHNSGVVHSGLYYKPGSLKARLSVEGREAIYRLCSEAGIPFERSGKLVIATHQAEIGTLDELERRGRANGLSGLRRISSDEIPQFEPEAVGLEALHIPEAGVADFPSVAEHIARVLNQAGATIMLDQEVSGIAQSGDVVTITTSTDQFRARVFVNCAGLHSDQVATLAGVEANVRIVPFRGEYYRLSERSAGLVKSLIYPVPDPRFPFLGVHFTRRIDGSVEVGPNAVLSLGREHYRNTKPDWNEVREILGHRGFRRLAMKHWRSGAKELVNSRSTKRYASLARRLVPALRSEDLVKGGVGVRAQAVGNDGVLVDDFVIERAGSTIHVLNAPSPGATASIAIGRYVATRASELI